jgi:hypothetical protein
MRSLIAVVLVTCSACSIKALDDDGGGDGASGGGNRMIPPGCPTAGADDVWADARLDCFTEGQSFIDISKSATGEPADTAYILVEQAMDDSFTSINGGKRRYFEYMLCVKGAPSSISTLSLASDFAVANGLGNFGWALPDGIATATMSISGNDDTGPYEVHTPCDPDQHPVIVDFATGKIESLNKGALANLKVTDH